MTHSTVRIAFYLLPSKKKEGSQDCPVYMRISYLNKSINLSTGIWLPENEWVAKKSKVKGNSSKAYSLNKQLQEMEDRIYQIVSSQQLQENRINLDTIKLKFRNKETSKTLLELFDYHIGNLKSRMNVNEYADITIRQYNICRERVVSFLKTPPYRSTDIILDKLDNEFINRFVNYIRSEYEIKSSSIAIYISKLKAVVHEGVRMGWLNRDPFQLYKNNIEKTHKEPLTLKEISDIENLEITNPYITIARDMFIFGTVTGLSFSDMRSLNKSHIVHTLNGTFIVYNRNKTGVPARVPYLDKAKAIVEKYKDHPLCKRKGVLLPVPAKDSFNRHLKLIGKMINTHKNITIHLSRHSFATNALEAGVPLITLSKALGHSDIKVTASTYAKVTDKQMYDSFNHFNDIVKSEELKKAK